MPESISPGWKLSSFKTASPPPSITPGGAPECWRADYVGQGSAQVWVCRYRARESAFDAVQRARAEAQTVKFQQGRNLVLVEWNNAPKENVTALVRAIQKKLEPDK